MLFRETRSQSGENERDLRKFLDGSSQRSSLVPSKRLNPDNGNDRIRSGVVPILANLAQAPVLDNRRSLSLLHPCVGFLMDHRLLGHYTQTSSQRCAVSPARY